MVTVDGRAGQKSHMHSQDVRDMSLEISLLEQHWSVITLAARDETLHALTTIVLLAALWPARRVNGFVLACAVAGSVLIDLDHLPGELGYGFLSTAFGRPITHGLATVAAVCVIALACTGRWRIGAFAVAFGIASHLLRDMATGGIAPFWPISSRTVEVEYGAYFLSLTGFVMLAVVIIQVGYRELPWANSKTLRERT
jgi:inner membrane protein